MDCLMETCLIRSPSPGDEGLRDVFDVLSTANRTFVV